LAGCLCILSFSVAVAQAEDAEMAGSAADAGATVVDEPTAVAEAKEPAATDTADDAAAATANKSATINESDAVAAKAASYDWAFTGYVAWMSGDQLGDMLIFNAKLSDNKFYVAALTRRLKTFYKDMDWEVEGQVAKHAGNGSGMYYWELNALTSVRWNRFVWDQYVDTSAATGLGLSWTSEESPFEIEEHDSTNKLLAYI